jgi:hypothetical protein
MEFSADTIVALAAHGDQVGKNIIGAMLDSANTRKASCRKI